MVSIPKINSFCDYCLIYLQSTSAVKEAVERLSKKELSGIWSVFVKWVTDSVESVNKELPEKEFALSTMLIMSSMATLSLTNVSSSEPQVLASCIKSMNATLKVVTCKKTGASICDMSEKYWKIHPELELEMSVNVISWLLNQALLPKATVSLNFTIFLIIPYMVANKNKFIRF